MRRSLVLPILLVLVAVPASAEVRAEYHPVLGWRVRFDARNGRPWTPVPSHDFGPAILNPGGDVAGDGIPAVGVRPALGLAEAVWSRAEGDRHELVLARHDAVTWQHVATITADTLESDVNPRLAYDDHGRSLLLWQVAADPPRLFVAGLSVDGSLWGEMELDGADTVPIALETDGNGFIAAWLDRAEGRIRFRRVDFPFPDGGPALPFPDTLLLLSQPHDEITGVDMGGPAGPGAVQLATFAATTLQLHRDGPRVWADWATDGEVRWVAFEGGVVIGRGGLALHEGRQVDQARRDVQRLVAGL